MDVWKLPLRLQLKDGRKIRSFVTRQGRLTKGQKQALESLWTVYGLEPGQVELASLMPEANARVLEIGFGNGASLAAMAKAAPSSLFIGIEVHQPGIGALLQSIQEHEIENLRLFYADARDVLELVPDRYLDRVQIFFPDPWPKKRHHKRRIIQPDFIEKIVPKLSAQGLIHCATDWEPYAAHMLDVLNQCPGLKNCNPEGGAMCSRPEYRPLTKFEARGQRLGHGVWDILFETNA